MRIAAADEKVNRIHWLVQMCPHEGTLAPPGEYD